MADRSTTERTVKTKFDGDASGGIRASRAMERELKRLHREAERSQAQFVTSATRGADRVLDVLTATTKGIFAVGSAVGSAQGLAGAGAAVATLSGTLLTLPGIALTGAAGLGVLTLATSGFMDVLGAEDLEEFNKLTKDMAPNAVATAKAIRDQSGRFAELKKIVQGQFFAGFDTDVRQLADRYFPILNKQGGEIAGQFNKMGRAATSALMTPGAVDDVNTVLGATKSTLKELEPAAANVVLALLDLGGEGAQSTERLGRAVTDVTADFRAWVAEGVKTGEINEMIEDGIELAKDFGRVFQNIGQIGGKLFSGMTVDGENFVDSLIEGTQAVEDFLESAEGQAALKTLGETLRVTADVARNVLGAALHELAPLIRDAGPGVQALVEGIGDFLVGAIEAVGPLLQGLGRFLSDNKDAVQDLVPLVLGLAVAVKGLSVAKDVAGWMSGLPMLFGSIGKEANAAAVAVGDPKGGAKGGLAGRLGGLKGLGAAGLVGAAAFIDLGGVREMSIAETLHVGGKTSELLPTITLPVDADTSRAQAEAEKLISVINTLAGTVNINGNDNPAAFALRQILTEISQGAETVLINGNEVPAQDALAAVLADINGTIGTVVMDGNNVPAGDALARILGVIGGSKADVQVGANTATAQGVINSFITMNNGKRIDIFVNAKGDMGGIASAGRLATGGRPFFEGRVRGPGGRTDDRAGLYRLSDDEHVLSAAEVDGLGGHGGVYRLRALARQGGFRGFAAGGTPAYLSEPLSVRSAAPRVSVAAPNNSITVIIDGREVRAIVQEEITTDRRQQRRTASMGSGGAW